MMQSAFTPNFDAKHGLIGPSSFQYNGKLNYHPKLNINEQRRNKTNTKQVREIINTVNGNFESVLSLVTEDLKFNKKQIKITNNSLTGIDSSINAICNAMHELQESIKLINYKLNNELNTTEQMKEYVGQQFNSLRLDRSLVHQETMELIQTAIHMNEKSNVYSKTKKVTYNFDLEIECDVSEFSIENNSINEKNNLQLQHHINDVSFKNDDNDKSIITDTVITSINQNISITTGTETIPLKSTSIEENKLNDELVFESEINSNIELEPEKTSDKYQMLITEYNDDEHYWRGCFFMYGIPIDQFNEQYKQSAGLFHKMMYQLILSIFHYLDPRSLWNSLLVDTVFNTIVEDTPLKMKLPYVIYETSKYNVPKFDIKKDFDVPLCYNYPNCGYGNRCRYYHPSSKKEYKEMIKNNLCWSYPDCPYGDHCRFAHVSSDEESYEENIT